MKFSIEEIKNYIMSQDSMGDILYNLSAENIVDANASKCSQCQEKTPQETLDTFDGVCEFCNDELN
jgi:hypothetical protein